MIDYAKRLLSSAGQLLCWLWTKSIEWDQRCPRCQRPMQAIYDPFLAGDWDAGWYIHYACPVCDGEDATVGENRASLRIAGDSTSVEDR